MLDESDRDGLRVVVEMKKGAIPEIVLNNLYKHTSLQTGFPCYMVISFILTLLTLLDCCGEWKTRDTQFEAVFGTLFKLQVREV